MSRIEWKILGLWLLTAVLIRLSLLLPHRYLDDIRLINTWIQVLLCVISAALVIKSSGGQRYIYINFAVLFGFVLFMLAGSFISQGAGSFYYHLYVNMIGDASISLAVVLFFGADYIFRNKSILEKYIIAFVATLLIIFATFAPFIYRPSELGSRKEFVVINHVKKAWDELSVRLNREPAGEEIMKELANDPEIGPGEYRLISDRIEELSASIKSNTLTAIFWQPVYRAAALNNIILCIVIGLILSVIYRYDRPYHAYVDKILLLLIPLFGLEAFHDWMSSASVSMDEFRLLFSIGQYVTVFIFGIMLFVFHLQLKFSESSVFAYYEEALDKTPAQITRWRDEIDTFILRLFTKSSKISRRMADIMGREGDKIK